MKKVIKRGKSMKDEEKEKRDIKTREIKRREGDEEKED